MIFLKTSGGGGVGWGGVGNAKAESPRLPAGSRGGTERFHRFAALPLILRFSYAPQLFFGGHLSFINVCGWDTSRDSPHPIIPWRWGGERGGGGRGGGG